MQRKEPFSHSCADSKRQEQCSSIRRILPTTSIRFGGNPMLSAQGNGNDAAVLPHRHDARHGGNGTETHGRCLHSGNGNDATVLHLNCYRAFGGNERSVAVQMQDGCVIAIATVQAPAMCLPAIATVPCVMTMRQDGCVIKVTRCTSENFSDDLGLGLGICIVVTVLCSSGPLASSGLCESGCCLRSRLLEPFAYLRRHIASRL